MVHVLNFFNGPGNRKVAAALDVRRGHRVLEVGFGGGAAIPTTASALGGDGLLCGVDLSADMARLANRFRDAGLGITPVFTCGNAEALPVKSSSFDRAYAMHSHLFWTRPLDGIRELHRVLRPGGRALLGLDARTGLHLARRFGRGYDPVDERELPRLLAEAGFVDVVTRKLSGGTVAVVGTRL
jgi:arsenite methyltransferase